ASSHTLSHLSAFYAPATPEFYTLSLHDALPISGDPSAYRLHAVQDPAGPVCHRRGGRSAHRLGSFRRVLIHNRTGARHLRRTGRSEEHTSELQSRENLVCRLLLEKKNKKGRKHE